MVVLVKFPLEIALLQSPLLKILFGRKMIPQCTAQPERERELEEKKLF